MNKFQHSAHLVLYIELVVLKDVLVDTSPVVKNKNNKKNKFISEQNKK